MNKKSILFISPSYFKIGEKIKAACGQDFLVEVHLSCNEYLIGGFTAEDVVEYAKAAEGKVDIFQIRGYDGLGAHPTGFNSEPDQDPMSLATCALVKQSGAKVIVAGNGGYQNLDDIERYIAEGKMDMASMALKDSITTGRCMISLQLTMASTNAIIYS